MCEDRVKLISEQKAARAQLVKLLSSILLM